MFALAVVFGTSVLLASGFLLLRGAEIRADRRFALAGVRCMADGWVEARARAAGSRLYAAEQKALAAVRATPHRLADLAALFLRLVATRALRMLRWIHERRSRGHAPSSDATKGSVSFFVSALGDARVTARQGQTRTSRGSF